MNNPYKPETKDIYEKKVEKGSRDRENITRRNLIVTYSTFWQLDISSFVSKIIVFLVLLFSFISVILNLLFSGFRSVRINLKL